VHGAGAHHHTISVPTLLARRSPAIGSLVCARLGDQELWELVNNTNELQNFHIHQTKICRARLPPGFADKDATRDPAIIATSHVPEFGTIAGVKDVDVWHDTLPVPP